MTNSYSTIDPLVEEVREFTGKGIEINGSLLILNYDNEEAAELDLELLTDNNFDCLILHDPLRISILLQASYSK